MTNHNITFNDIPDVLSQMIERMEQLEKNGRSIIDEIYLLRDQINPPPSGCTPMTADEAAKYLRLPKNSLYYYIREGKLPAVKQGKRYILIKEKLEQWMEAGRLNDVPSDKDRMESDLAPRVGRKLGKKFN